jgi:hypothetical protein
MCDNCQAQEIRLWNNFRELVRFHLNEEPASDAIRWRALFTFYCAGYDQGVFDVNEGNEDDGSLPNPENN